MFMCFPFPQEKGKHINNVTPTHFWDAFFSGNVPVWEFVFQDAARTEPEPETETVGIVFPGTEIGRFLMGLV